MRRAAERCGGVCTGACDQDEDMRMGYLSTFGDASESVHNLSQMGSDPRVARESDIILCGFCCKPFSPAGSVKGYQSCVKRAKQHFPLVNCYTPVYHVATG